MRMKGVSKRDSVARREEIVREELDGMLRRHNITLSRAIIASEVQETVNYSRSVVVDRRKSSPIKK